MVRPEDHQAHQGDSHAPQGADVARFLLPLAHQDDDEQGGHGEVHPRGVEGDELPQHRPQNGAGDPIGVVEQRHKEVEPPLVHPLGNVGGDVDRKGLVTHPEDGGELFPAQVPVLLQHGDPVEHMPGVDHQGQEEGTHRGEQAGEHAARHELHGSGEDKEADEDGDHRREAQGLHIDPIGHPQHQKPRQDGDGVRKGRLGRGGGFVLWHGMDAPFQDEAFAIKACRFPYLNPLGGPRQPFCWNRRRGREIDTNSHPSPFLLIG